MRVLLSFVLMFRDPVSDEDIQLVLSEDRDSDDIVSSISIEMREPGYLVCGSFPHVAEIKSGRKVEELDDSVEFQSFASISRYESAEWEIDDNFASGFMAYDLTALLFRHYPCDVWASHQKVPINEGDPVSGIIYIMETAGSVWMRKDFEETVLIPSYHKWRKCT